MEPKATHTEEGNPSRPLQQFAEVIIPLPLPKNYTWAIPPPMVEKVQPGIRVEVVLGKNKKYAGIVKKVHQEKPVAFEPKPILNVLDSAPLISELQLQLWSWMASYYLCSEGEVMAAALPAHFKLSSETILVYNEEYGDDFSDLDHEEFLVADALLVRRELKITEVQQVLDVSHVYPVIRKLIDKNLCFVWESLKESYSPKKETYVVLNPEYEKEEKLEEVLNHWGRAPKQLELLLSYLHLVRSAGSVTKKDLLQKSQASEAQLKGLVEKNLLRLEKRAVDRVRYLPREVNIDFTLTEKQEQSLQQIREQLAQRPVCLFHGATSCGKTLIYIRLIESIIRNGSQVLYLLPEIALTAQIIRRLQRHFGGYIGIYHSKFNQNERVEIWNKVRSGELKVVLGARSALFLPFADLRLIIVDEEHDASYKQQDPAPRYHARDAAIYYASLYPANVVLGSATPSMESYYNAQSGKYGLVQLNERYGGIEAPAINIVDTRQLMKAEKHRVILTPALRDAIQQSLSHERQVILFQNRRGYAPYQVCRVCGWIPHCHHCDVSLTYHKHTHKLHCHYCGASYPLVVHCAACGNHDFQQQLFGTERIEEHLEEAFPDARIARMDMDSVRGKQSHDQLILQFEERRIDILIGTQMVVKGLDFENVDLVGILDADSLLSFADFRVNERAFQLMEQVSGRAGRKHQQGHVWIQVSQTTHPVLSFVRQHDYPSFYHFELEGRKKFLYPPYSRMIKLTFKHKLREVTDAAAHWVGGQLKPQFGTWMLGPAAPVVNRVRNQFLAELFLKLPKSGGSVQQAKELIPRLIAALHQEKPYKGVLVVADVDPV